MTIMEQLRDMITARFDALDARIEDLTIQVKETNGRVRKGEMSEISHAARLDSIEVAVSELRRLQTGNWRLLRGRLVEFVLVISGTVAVLQFLGLLHR